MGEYELRQALEAAQAKLKEQDDYLRQLTEAALVYAVVLGKDGSGYKVATDRGSMQRVNLTRPYKRGDILLLHPQSGQPVEQSTFVPLGATTNLVRQIDDHRWEVGSSTEAKIVTFAHNLNPKLFEQGDKAILDPSGHVILQVLPRPKSQHNAEHTNVRWEHIGGQEEAKLQMQEAIALLRGGSKIFKAYRAKAPKGVLLYGPPGCGKTLIAKAVATELSQDGQGAFIYVKAPEILNKFVGESEYGIRNIFAMSRAYKQDTGRTAVVFIDECDAIMGHRGSGISSDMEKTLVPSFLTEMDGMEESSALIILATNRADTLDPAIIRDGRIDAKIKIDRPGRQQVQEIFGINLNGLPLHNEHSQNALAECATEELYKAPTSRHMSGAMVAGVVQRATRLVVRRDVGHGHVTGMRMSDLSSAINEVHREHAA